jgi:hypothetical protein
LRPYTSLAADALFEMDTVVISAVLSLDEYLSQKTIPVSRNVVTGCRTVALFGNSLSG